MNVRTPFYQREVSYADVQVNSLRFFTVARTISSFSTYFYN